MRIVVANNMAPFTHGGAEELATHLARRLSLQGHDVELVRIPFAWEPYLVLPKQMAIARQIKLDSADALIALKFPAYVIPHQNKTVWLLHQYRQAYDLYESGHTNLPADEDGQYVRTAIRRADNQAFTESRKIFTNSPVTGERLAFWNSIASEVLYPPLNDPELFPGGDAEPYIFAGGRIDDLKRQEMLVRAVARAPRKVRLVVAGPPDSPHTAARLQRLTHELGIEDRVTLDLRFLSRIEIARWVNGAAACAYIPYDEDSLGYVVMEAAEASKPVITTIDSGGIRGLVRHDETGWVVPPEEEALGEAMGQALSSPSHTRSKGRQMRAHWLSFDADWSRTIERLLA